MNVNEALRTFLGDASALVGVELLLVARALDSDVAASTRQGEVHGLVEELEALDLLDRFQSRLLVVEDDKRLALGLEIALGDDIDDIAVLGKDDLEGFLERLGLDALFKVAHVDPVNGILLAGLAVGLGMHLNMPGCEETYVVTGGLEAIFSDWIFCVL